MAEPTVEFSALVPKREFDRFKENFPQYGATKWFINAMLTAFNDRVEAEPSLRELIDEAIENSLELAKLISQAAALAAKASDKRSGD